MLVSAVSAWEIVIKATSASFALRMTYRRNGAGPREARILDHDVASLYA